MVNGNHKQGLRIRTLLAVLAVSAVPVPAALAQAEPAPQVTAAQWQAQIEAEPGNAALWTGLGNAQLEAGDFEAARTSFLEARSLDYLAGDAHYGLGLAEYNRGDYQAALFSFSEVARLHPDRFDGHYNQAVTLARLRQPEAAAAAFRSAIANAEPEATLDDEFNANLGLAGQLRRIADHAGAAAAYEAALLLFPDDHEVEYLHAESLFLAGQGLEALPLLIDLEGRSSDYRVSSLIADIYVGQGQVDYALRAVERAQQRAGRTGAAGVQANLYIKLGLLERQLGRDADAIGTFTRATTLDPASWEAHYNLGVSYLETGQAGSSAGPLETAVILAGERGDVKLALAVAYDQLGRSAEALELARDAALLLEDPLLAAQAGFILGRSQYRQGDFAAAASTLALTVQERPGDAQAQLWAGLSEYALGNYRTAAQYYERAVQLDPGSIESRLNLGAAYLASEQFKDAEQVYQSLLEQNPADTASLYNLGWALISQNQRLAARGAWEQAQSLGHQEAAAALSEYF
jgi:tetratricopeptide (TPR) repeat protein